MKTQKTKRVLIYHKATDKSNDNVICYVCAEVVLCR